MKKSKVILLTIIGILVIGLLVIGFALLTNVGPGQEEDENAMNNEEKAIAAEAEPLVQVIFEKAKHHFVKSKDGFTSIDIELDRAPSMEDDRLLSGFIFQLVRQHITEEGEVVLHYTEQPEFEEKERF